MVAQIAGFASRADLGLRKPRSVSRSVTPSQGGIALHYGGASGPPSTHAGCISRWRSWQNYHMDSHKWVDIAYNFGVCNHGWVFAGRGFGVRSAANGTNAGNQYYLAACWIGGGNYKPTQAALDAFDWVINESRRLGGGDFVRPHRYFKSTSCPGNYLDAHAALRHNKPIPLPQKPAPVQPPADNEEEIMVRKGATGPVVRVIQECLKNWNPKALPTYGVDEDYGDETFEWVARYQRSADFDDANLPITGNVDGVTFALLVRYSNEVVK